MNDQNWRFNLNSIDNCSECGKLFCNDEGENGECTREHDHDESVSASNIETGEMLCMDCAKERGVNRN